MAFDANTYPNSSGLILNRFLGVSANIDSNSTTSGAVQVIGGIGMTGNLYSASVCTGNIFLNTAVISTAANSVQPKQYTDVMAVVFGM
jgi:hypothetical protein